MKLNKTDFPILKRRINNHPLVYLDSAASSLTPEPVLKAMQQYYQGYRANVHRAVYQISEEATEKFEGARKKLSSFINSYPEEIIFTRNATEALNLLAYSLSSKLSKKDEVVLTEMEHHSNLVPWQQMSKKHGFRLSFIKVDKEGKLNLKHAKSLINKNTKILSFTHMSNLLGTINPVSKLAELAHRNNSIVILDAAQSIPHIPIDVKKLKIDFMAFSGHKMLGPTGVGCLYGKKELLEKLQPFQYGGGMISEVSFNNTLFTEPPLKFEAGTPDIAGVIGLSAAIDYLQKIKMSNIQSHTESLTQYALKQMSGIPGIEIYGPKSIKERGGIISFNLDNIHPHDVASVLDKEGIAIRAGHMCAMPLVKQILKKDAVCRASFYIYNTKDDIDALVRGLKKVRQVFR